MFYLFTCFSSIYTEYRKLIGLESEYQLLLGNTSNRFLIFSIFSIFVRIEFKMQCIQVIII